jgi:hypothetical protein
MDGTFRVAIFVASDEGRDQVDEGRAARHHHERRFQ